MLDDDFYIFLDPAVYTPEQATRLRILVDTFDTHTAADRRELNLCTALAVARRLRSQS